MVLIEITREKPTILFVHGGWHSSAHFEPIISLLSQHSYPALCPQLPSYYSRTTINLYDDASTIRSALAKLVETEGKEVLVVFHSYGGQVGTEAVYESFGKKYREKLGLKGGVVGLFYMCAFILPLGQSVVGSGNGGLVVWDIQPDGSAIMLNPGHACYNDLPEEQSNHWVSLLHPNPAGAFISSLTYVAYKYYPIAYLYCENDQAIPIEFQRSMVKAAKDMGVSVREETFDGGHSPFLSHPAVVFKAVEGFLNSLSVNEATATVE